MGNYHVYICFFILSFWDEWALTRADKLAIKAKEGETITHSCSYNLYWTISKVSFCREPCADEDTLVETRGGRAQSSRYSIIFEKEKWIYLSISNVTKSDSGSYVCAIHRPVIRVSKETFEVQVEDVGPTKQWTTSTTSPTTPQPDNKTAAPVTFTPQWTTSEVMKQSGKDNQAGGVLLYLGVMLVIMVIVLAAAGLIFFRKRNHHTASKREKHLKRSSEQHPSLILENPEVDQVYEEIRDEITSTEDHPENISTVYTLIGHSTATPAS